MARTVKTYFDINRNRWVNSNNMLLLERQYPYVNTFETPIFVLNLLEDGQPYTLPLSSTFTFALCDNDGNTLAVPYLGHVNNPNDYYYADPKNGVLSFLMQMDIIDLIDFIDGKTCDTIYAVLTVESDSKITNLRAPVKVYNIPNNTIQPIPLPVSSQYRINPNDGGTDIWDYGTSKWVRQVLVNGVMEYYEAP